MSVSAAAPLTADASGFERAEGMGHQVSATIPDPERERVGAFEWNGSRRLLRAIRVYQRARDRGGLIGAVCSRWAVLEHRFWSVVSGADIPLNCRLGGGLIAPHPNGIVIHPDAVIGPNCLIFQQVTIGAGAKPGYPVIGGHVDIGAGAKILGPVRIGDHARIGANAVVLSDVPAGATAVGIPARVVTSRDATDRR
jgi:serine O-acetyltransferase